MSINGINSIRVKRGLKEDLPTRLPSGEPAFCVDTHELYIGMGEDLDPVPVGVSGDIDIEGELVNLDTLIKNHQTRIVFLETQVGGLENQVNSILAMIGKPNGIAPLDSDGLIPTEHLPQVDEGELSTILYYQPTTNTSSMEFYLTGIDLVKYKKVTITHTAPHTCVSNLYINNKHVTSIATTGLVDLTLQSGTVTGKVANTTIAPVTVGINANSTFRWSYNSGCADPKYYDLTVIGYY